MRVLISGGTGLIGTALTASLLEDGNPVWVLTRNPRAVPARDGLTALHWDGRTVGEWGQTMGQMEAVVNLAGENLARWPWTTPRKQRFWQSRVDAGRALTEAIRGSSARPKVFVQATGINHYGLHGEVADESTPPGDDFLARLTVAWEDATRDLDELGIRRCILRTAVVLAKRDSLLTMMALPVRLFAGGRLGSGHQAVPWVHISDVVGALRFLLENESLKGPFNLIAPEQTSNADFYRSLARILRRPYWFPTPAFLLRRMLGEMSVLIVAGRYARPARLLEAGYEFRFGRLEPALRDLLGS
jgi:uncharacterized protein (TIGR01777 family)